MSTKNSREKRKGKFQCARCGFNKAECLEYVDCELLCQNCIYLKQSQKERDSKNLGDLIGELENEGDVEETYEGTVVPVKGFTVLLTESDVLMPEVA